MSSIRQLLRMYAQGKGKKQISILTGLSRNTIKKYLRKFVSLKLTYAEVEAMSDHELDLLFIPPPAPPPQTTAMNNCKHCYPIWRSN